MIRILRFGAPATAATCLLLVAGQASAGGSGMPWEGPLQQIVESVTGPVVQAAAVIAVVLFGGGVAMSENGSRPCGEVSPSCSALRVCPGAAR